MEEDVFKFDDFVSGGKMNDLQKIKDELLKEGLFSDHEEYGKEDIFKDDEESLIGEEEVNQEFNPYKTYSEIEEEDDDVEKDEGGWEGNPYDYIDSGGFMDDEDEDLEESKSNTEEYYKLFKDKSEDFVCDIAVEGVNQEDTEVRLIVESDDWNLMFIGEIKNGKCIIPIKKLNILNEGQTGNIRLEVNADGNLFTPWEDKFVVKMSKKVTIKLNEGKKSRRPIKKIPGVKVNVRK